MVRLIRLAKNVSKYCVGMEGNVSTKKNNTILIKASGCKLKNLSPETIVMYNTNGEQLNNFNIKGSMELDFHTYLLGFNNVDFVSHVHPPKTLAILSSKQSSKFANERYFPEQVVFNGKKSCLVPYATPGNELFFAIKKSVESFIAENGEFPKLILLENHGIITCGETIEECIQATDICEKAASVFIDGFNLSLEPLTVEEVTKLVHDDNEIYRQKKLR